MRTRVPCATLLSGALVLSLLPLAGCGNNEDGKPAPNYYTGPLTPKSESMGKPGAAGGPSEGEAAAPGGKPDTPGSGPGPNNAASKSGGIQ